MHVERPQHSVLLHPQLLECVLHDLTNFFTDVKQITFYECDRVDKHLFHFYLLPGSYFLGEMRLFQLLQGIFRIYVLFVQVDVLSPLPYGHSIFPLSLCCCYFCHLHCCCYIDHLLLCVASCSWHLFSASCKMRALVSFFLYWVVTF